MPLDELSKMKQRDIKTIKRIDTALKSSQVLKKFFDKWQGIFENGSISFLTNLSHF